MAKSSYIGLGSNLDDRLDHIKEALQLLNNTDGCKVLKVSSMYESKPYGYTKQNNFLNCVAEISTVHSLKELLKVVKEIEKQIGRKQREKWGPREIDLDILFYDDTIYNDNELNVPHKDVMNRDFVLVPLCEIAPELIDPVSKKKICEIDFPKLETNIISKFEFNFI